MGEAAPVKDLSRHYNSYADVCSLFGDDFFWSQASGTYVMALSNGRILRIKRTAQDDIEEDLELGRRFAN